MKLLSCPFCGGRPYIEDSHRSFVDGKSTKVCFIRCRTCNARSERVNVQDYGNKSRSMDAINKVAMSWNMRDRFPTEFEIPTYYDRIREYKESIAAQQATPTTITGDPQPTDSLPEQTE